jgi:hypothetical protein
MTDGFPQLTCKAWNGQIMLLFLDSCLQSLVQDQPCQESTLAALALRALSCWFDRLVRYPRYLSEAQSKEISMHGFSFLRLYNKLAILSVVERLGRWKLIPKHHPFRHMQEDMRNKRYNYRYVHTYKDEDHVGILKKLAERVHKGDLLEFRVLTRFLLRLASWQPT